MTGIQPQALQSHSPYRATESCPPRPIRRRPSFVAVDLLAAAGLALTIIIIFTTALRQYATGQDDADARRVLRLEAENYLHRIRVLDTARASAVPQPVPPPASGVVLSVTETAGTGDWSGFTLVRVIARKRLTGGRWIAVDLSAYVPARRDRP